MKKFIYMLATVIPFLFIGFPALSMPPHPDLLEKWRQEGTLETNMKKVQAASVIRKNMNANKASSIGNGIIKIPVILIKYSDSGLSAFATYGTTSFSQLLNGQTSSSLSVKKYYSDMSNGNLSIQFDVYGPVTVSGNHDYYGNNTGGASTDAHPAELARDAINEAKAGIDFSLYDNNSDGYVDCVILIHAGTGEEVTYGSPTDIWSHQWDLVNAGLGAVSDDGKLVSVYTIQPEYVAAAGDSTIGVFCHELGHVFGLPDLYDTSYATNGAGIWSLMASGSYGPTGGNGSHPAPLLAWERYRIGGASWLNYAEITPSVTGRDNRRFDRFYQYLFIFTLVVLSLFTAYRLKKLRPLAAPVSALVMVLGVSCSIQETTTVINGIINDIEVSHSAYRIPLGNGQYLFLEGKAACTSSTPNWTTSGWYVPGTGVLVTHVHEGIISKYISNNTVNDGDTRVHGVNIVEAKTAAEPGQLWGGSYYGSADDLFCSENNSTLTTATTPGTKYYTSEAVSSKTGDSSLSITSFTSKASFPITFYAEY